MECPGPNWYVTCQQEKLYDGKCKAVEGLEFSQAWFLDSDSPVVNYESS